MPVRMCRSGHLTGFRVCPQCNSPALRDIGGNPVKKKMDKRVKRAITIRIIQEQERLNAVANAAVAR